MINTSGIYHIGISNDYPKEFDCFIGVYQSIVAMYKNQPSFKPYIKELSSRINEAVNKKQINPNESIYIYLI